MNIESAGYRFMDSSGRSDENDQSAPIFTVEFYPSVEDYVHIASNRVERRPVTTWTKWGIQFFYFINSIIAPAILLFLGYGWLALGLFLLNLVLAILLLPAQVKADYRNYFKSLYPNIENELVRIELWEAGIKSLHNDGFAFHPWKSITAIEETADSFYFYLTGTGIAVRKNGFAYADQAKTFLDFARSHQRPSENPRLRNDY